MESSELRKIILKQFENELGINNFKSLALELRHKNISKNEVSSISSNIFESYFSTEPGLKRKSEKRAKLLSKRFPNALEKLARLYELQQNK